MGKFFAILLLVAFLFVGGNLPEFVKPVYLMGFIFGAATALIWTINDSPVEDKPEDEDKRP